MLGCIVREVFTIPIDKEVDASAMKMIYKHCGNSVFGIQNVAVRSSGFGEDSDSALADTFEVSSNIPNQSDSVLLRGPNVETDLHETSAMGQAIPCRVFN